MTRTHIAIGGSRHGQPVTPEEQATAGSYELRSFEVGPKRCRIAIEFLVLSSLGDQEALALINEGRMA